MRRYVMMMKVRGMNYLCPYIHTLLLCTYTLLYYCMPSLWCVYAWHISWWTHTLSITNHIYTYTYTAVVYAHHTTVHTVAWTVYSCVTLLTLEYTQLYLYTVYNYIWSKHLNIYKYIYAKVEELIYCITIKCTHIYIMHGTTVVRHI